MGSSIPHLCHSYLALTDESFDLQVISRYGTIPRGARIGAFLASLEQTGQSNGTAERRGSDDHSGYQGPHWQTNGNRGAQDPCLMPTLEVTRKVEEWKAGVEKSLADEKNKNSPENNGEMPDQNVKPSSILHGMAGRTPQNG